MLTVDEILSKHDSKTTIVGAESELKIQRFDRKPHIATVRRLSKVNGWKTTGFLLFHWAILLATMALIASTMHWAVIVVGAFLIASRMQALGVMLHDATHYLLYKNRSVNDVVSDLFIAFPLGMSTTLYRKTHFRHHRFTSTELDQDLAAQRQEVEWYEWPKTRWGCAKTLLRTLFGLNVHRGWILLKHWAPWYHMRDPINSDFPLRSRILYVLSTIVVYSAMAIGLKMAPRETLTIMGVYMVAGFTLLNLINRIRATAEHLRVPGTHELNATRTVLPSLIERFFIAPYGVNFHLEHHLFPSVPGYNLGELHRELMADREFSEKAHLTKTYVGLIGELMQPQSELVKCEGENVGDE